MRLIRHRSRKPGGFYRSVKRRTSALNHPKLRTSPCVIKVPTVFFCTYRLPIVRNISDRSVGFDRSPPVSDRYRILRLLSSWVGFFLSSLVENFSSSAKVFRDQITPLEALQGSSERSDTLQDRANFASNFLLLEILILI